MRPSPAAACAIIALAAFGTRAAAQNPPAAPPPNPPAAAAPQPAAPADSLAAQAPRSDTGRAPNTDTTSSPLAIRPGDVIRLQVWGHEEMSGEFPVDENYNVVFPLIGSINVQHVTVGQLRDHLNTSLGQLFQRPFFTLTPMFRVAVLGEVMKPGLYSVDPTLTVVDLLALAGGPTRQANQKKLQLIRGGRAVPVPLDPSSIARSTLRELGVHSGDQLVMPRAFLTRDDLGLIINIANFLLLAYITVRR
jgi:protein involved in polysaccharide export with SLBB domain